MQGCSGQSRYYFLEANTWLKEHGVDPFQPNPRAVRNREWLHMVNDDVISMPDKWEYPWYAAWDLAFHTIALTGVDLDFAKDQLNLMLRERYLHTTGQIPAYEWNFGDVNPPVHAWATIFQYRMEQAQRGAGDLEFLKRVFGKLLLNFTWWVNRKDRSGKNVFEGGFLGLTISVSSIAAQPCRQAATSNRRTAPRGWQCTARTCSRSPWSSRRTIEATRTSLASSPSISCGLELP